MKKLYTSVILFVLICIVFNIQANGYKRIVSLAPSLTKSIYSLNSQAKMVGCTSYCKEATTDKKVVVASMVTVNIEKIIGLNPDLVIAASITNPEYIQQLEKFGIRVVVFHTPKSYTEICNQFIELGQLIGKKEAAIKIINDISSKLDVMKKEFAQSKRRKVFFQIGAEPLFTVLPKTFMNDYIENINGINIASGLTKGTVSREFVITGNPDIIFITTMGIIGNEEKRTWESYKDLSAVKDNRIFIIESDIACTPTPVTFLKTMEVIYNSLKN